MTLLSRSTPLQSSAHFPQRIAQCLLFPGRPFASDCLSHLHVVFDANSSSTTVSELSLPFTVTFRNTADLRSKAKTFGLRTLWPLSANYQLNRGRLESANRFLQTGATRRNSSLTLRYANISSHSSGGDHCEPVMSAVAEVSDGD